MRVVIDSNLLISAMLWGRGPGRLLGAAVRGEQKLFLSEAFLSELGNVIVRGKFENRLRLKSLSARSLLDAILDTATIVSAPSIPAPDSLRDPDDAHVLACALAAEADAIVTGDKDLLVLKEFEGIPILNVSKALARLGER